MFNNTFYPYGNNGMVPNPNAQQMPVVSNWLPADKYAMLQKIQDQFKLSVSEEELTKGQCNHYYQNGTSALIPSADGSGGCTCAICGTSFHSHDFTEDDVKNATQNILDILNTIKVMYLSIDKNAAMEYFQIIPFLEKIPALYNIAVNDFKKYEGVSSFVPNNQQNPFSVLSFMMGSPMMGQQPVMGQAAPMGYPQAPVYGQPVGYQQYPNAQQPMAPQAAPAPGSAGFNPMYGQAPMGGYQPQAQGYVFNPQGAAQPVAQPQAPQQMVNTNMPVQPQTTPATIVAPQAAPAQTETAPAVTEFKK